MTKTDIERLAKKHLDKNTTEEKISLAKKTKSGCYLGIIIVSAIIIFFVYLCIDAFIKNNGSGISFLFITLGGVVGLLLFMSKYRFCTLRSDEEWCLAHYADEIRKAAKAHKKNKASFAQLLILKAEDVVSVELVDKHTEITDKLHGFLNYQEIIQTRYFTFKITFSDNDAELLKTKEGSRDCEQLLILAKKIKD